MALKCIDAAKLYQRDTNIRKEDVQILQEWLKKQPHLPKLEESQIIIFLHSCYYRIEPAKTTIDNYFTVRTLCPNIFHCLTKDEIRNALATGFLTILPKSTPDKNAILMAKLIDSKVETFNSVHLINVINTVTLLHISLSGFDDGAVAVFDMAGFSFAHLTRLNLSAIKQALYFVQECAPVRIKQIHVVNVTSFVDRLIGMLKPFMKGELYNLIQLHAGVEPLYKYVPKECLPEEFGGLLPTCQILQEDNIKYIMDNYDFLKWHDSQEVDERKRMGKPKTANDVFGVEGTFKKLEID